MLIGSTDIDNELVTELVDNHKALIAYAESLVPLWAKHLPHVINNQRYYMALMIRNMLHISFYVRMSACKCLMEGCYICGIVNEVIPISRVFDACNTELLVKMLKKDFSPTSSRVSSVTVPAIVKAEIEALTGKLYEGDASRIIYNMFKDTDDLNGLISYITGEDIKDVCILQDTGNVVEVRSGRPCLKEWLRDRKQL